MLRDNYNMTISNKGRGKASEVDGDPGDEITPERK